MNEWSVSCVECLTVLHVDWRYSYCIPCVLELENWTGDINTEMIKIDEWLKCKKMQSISRKPNISHFVAKTSKRSIFRITGLLWGESTGYRWIPFTKASDAELWCFLWCLNRRLSKQSRRRWYKTPLRPLLRHCNDKITDDQQKNLIGRVYFTKFLVVHLDSNLNWKENIDKIYKNIKIRWYLV